MLNDARRAFRMRRHPAPALRVSGAISLISLRHGCDADIARAAGCRAKQNA
jgi:hypothetical protein